MERSRREDESKSEEDDRAETKYDRRRTAKGSRERGDGNGTVDDEFELRD